jgi:hypothetical protein
MLLSYVSMNPPIIAQPVLYDPLDKLIVLLAHMHIAPSVSHSTDQFAFTFKRGIARTLRTLAQVVEAMGDVSLFISRLVARGRVNASIKPSISKIPHDHVKAVELMQRGNAVAIGCGV